MHVSISERTSGRTERSSIQWFAPHMTETAMSGSVWSQGPGTPSESSTQIAGTKPLELSSIAVPATSKEAGSEVQYPELKPVLQLEILLSQAAMPQRQPLLTGV